MRILRDFVYVLAALGTVTAATGCAGEAAIIVDDPDGTLFVDNQSDFAIVDIRLTPVGSSTPSGNLLDGDVLLPGESLTLDVSCGVYDAFLVDEDGADCELFDVDLCLNDADWIIRNNTCTSFGAARAAREAAAKAAATPDAGSATPPAAGSAAPPAAQ